MTRYLLLFACMLALAPGPVDAEPLAESPIQQKAFLWNHNQGMPPNPEAALAAAGLALENRTPRTVATGDQGPATPLALADLVSLVVADNQQIKGHEAQWGIQKTGVDKAAAIFEPEFVTSLSLADRSQKNTVEEAASRQFESIYAERNWDYNASVGGLLPTGGKINLGYTYRRLSNTLTRTLTDEDREHQMFLGLSLTQPLLKNAGIDATKAGIRVAETESEVAFQEYRQGMMRTVGEAAATYWTFFQAQEKLRMRQDSLNIAEQLLNDSLERYRTGKMSETDVLEARIGVASRRALQIEARQEHHEAMNRLRTLIALAAGQDTPRLEATERPHLSQAAPDRQTLMRRAFKLRPEYLATQKRIDRAGIKIAYAKNQLWPELDLKASYGLNGLDFSSGDSWDQIEGQDFDDWSVGLELRVPLQGNRDGKADLQKAKLEQTRALLMLKSIEVELTNNIDTAMHNIRNASEQLGYAVSVVEIHQQLLDAEQARLGAGRSNSRLVLEKEENFQKAQEAALKNLVSLQKAMLDLEIEAGSILASNGAEIMEVEL
ncbi:TolC family protein [Trichloromonas sp.]|uniref:TolC family protein n=1 Tax=Trichloromonas sp. TaxID=3069249 RepID=UPI003D81AEE2